MDSKIEVEEVRTKMLVVEGEGGSVVVRGHGGLMGIWVADKDNAHTVAIYVDAKQGGVVGIYDKTTVPGCDLALSVRDNDPAVQFCKDGKATVLDVPELLQRLERLEAISLPPAG